MEESPPQNSVEVSTQKGVIRGRFVETNYGSKGYRFMGVPYGKTPIGPLRFLPPVPADPWPGTLDCTSLRPSSCTLSHDYEIIGNEDCLYVNIYTPALKCEQPLPVIVFILGWNYMFIPPQILGTGLLTNRNVIIVECSYRLGVFGFLTTGEVNAPGNCGLKDVVLALRWVQDNICVFGGNPENVTLLGTGSGAAMVHLLVLSCVTSGLFHKAIIQSGSALNSWALNKNPINSTKVLIRELGISHSDPAEAVEQLRYLPAEEIMKAYKSITLRHKQQMNLECMDALFRPCIENEFEGQTAFITKNPFTILKSGKFNKVPMIIGGNRSEGTIIKLINSEGIKFDSLNMHTELLVPRELHIETNKSKNIGLRLLQFYLSGETLSEETSSCYYQFLTDYYFLYNLNKSVKLHSTYSPNVPIYYYIFEYNGFWKLDYEERHKFLMESDTHSAELFYLFQSKDKAYSGSRETILTRDRMLKMWTNFAKYGNPTPEDDDKLIQISWQPVKSKDKLVFLNIGAELTIGCNPFYDRMAFWDELLDDTAFLRMSAYFDRQDSS